MSSFKPAGRIQPVEMIEGFGVLPDGKYKRTLHVEVPRAVKNRATPVNLNLVIMTDEANGDDYAFHIGSSCEVPMEITVKNGRVSTMKELAAA